ncbi:hypothetical protein [Streptomyces lydicus]|uniref:hypothetical protein n=1 Tax=Streptomyces lydicus TaxID=47763 RepID=UPI001011EFC4|nr:hypothetical protein [Streptomyces lydicus]MCZ1011681.1 hypothetical protein [Streptomyces lydicus]
MTRVAPRLTALLAGHFEGNLPVRLRAWDGSEAGPKEAPSVSGSRQPARLALTALRLAVRTTPAGETGMPATPHDRYAGQARP